MSVHNLLCLLFFAATVSSLNTFNAPIFTSPTRKFTYYSYSALVELIYSLEKNIRTLWKCGVRRKSTVSHRLKLRFKHALHSAHRTDYKRAHATRSDKTRSIFQRRAPWRRARWSQCYGRVDERVDKRL